MPLFGGRMPLFGGRIESGVDLKCVAFMVPAVRVELMSNSDGTALNSERLEPNAVPIVSRPL
jgi:hypothetical protein